MYTRRTNAQTPQSVLNPARRLDLRNHAVIVVVLTSVGAKRVRKCYLVDSWPAGVGIFSAQEQISLCLHFSCGYLPSGRVIRWNCLNTLAGWECVEKTAGVSGNVGCFLFICNCHHLNIETDVSFSLGFSILSALITRCHTILLSGLDWA